MIEKPVSLATQAKTHYSNNGFRSLVMAGGEKVAKTAIQRRSLSRSELKKIATQRDSIWHLEQEDAISIAPLEHNTLRKVFEEYPKRYTPEKPFICELEDCYLLGSTAVGLTREGRFIEDTVSGNFPFSEGLVPSTREFYMRALGIKKKQAQRSTNNIVFPLISEYHSYYHWMVEYLPKLRFLEYYIEETGKEPTILVESNPRGFVQDTLSVAGYESDRYEEWDGKECHIDTLVVPIHRSHRFDYQSPKQSDYNPSRADLLWLRRRMRSNVDYNTDSDGEIIYISRQDVPKERGRKVLNYDSIISVIDEFNGQSYTLEEMTFEEQVALFAESDLIISPHGAGLLNMTFADNPTVVELFPDSVLKPHFYFMSDMLGFEYSPLVTESEGENLVVSKSRLRNHIESIVKTQD